MKTRTTRVAASGASSLLIAALIAPAGISSAQTVQSIERHIVPTERARLDGPKPTSAEALGDSGVAYSVGVPSALFDVFGIGWVSFRDATSNEFSDHFNQMKDDYLMLDIEVDVVNGSDQLAAVWQDNFDNRGWAELRNLTSAEFSDKWNFYRDLGYRLIDQESYVLNNTRYYAGIWVENKENLAWASYRNATSQEFSDNFTTYTNLGYIMVDVEAYPVNNGSELRYAAAWVENAENLSWIEHRDMTSAEFSDKFNQYRAQYRVWDIESYRFNGTQYYAAIWIENKNGNGWAEWRDMTATGYRNRWYRLRDLGYRLVDFEKYDTGSGFKYAGVWRQNNGREDWALKNDIDQLIETEKNTYDIPGIGVGVSVFGKTEYLRGFGDSDVDAGIWYSSRTVNRLASISKALGGVLAMRLVERRLIDLDRMTRDYEPSLPRAHTHTIRQLVSNRGGIGHYNEHGSVNAQFATALDGVQFFLNDPLPYQPGTGCLYSTHGSTLAAVAYEAVLSKSIDQIAEEELSTALGLPTLKPEDRSKVTIDWAALYNTDNSEATPDFLDWKRLGGGFVSSPYDLLRFGMKLLNNEVISETSRTEMWTVPAPNCSNYALGWNVGTDQGTPVAAKDGAQLGARTYIRIYPEIEAVIVVLSNRQGGGHNAVQLGRDIGTLLLNMYLGVGTESPGTPEEFVLEAAYPNPFVETMTLRYRLPTPDNVKVEVFDLLGRRVTTITDGLVPSGAHALVWDGTDDSGREVSAGVYFVHFSTDRHRETTPVVVVR